MMKEYKHFGIVVTVGLSIIILTAGTFLASWADTFVPSYKNQIAEVAGTNSNNKIFQLNKQASFQLYPWNYYSDNKQPVLTKAQQELLLQKKVPDFIFSMLDKAKAGSSEKSALVSQFELLTVPIQDEKSLKIKDGYYFVIKNVKIENSDYYVDCAVTQDGEIVSFHTSKSTGKPSDSVLEHAQTVLQNDSSKGFANLTKFTKKIISMTFGCGQTQISELMQFENTLTVQNNNKPKFITTNNMVLVNYKTQNGMNLIFDFDPTSLAYCGFHVQQSK